MRHPFFFGLAASRSFPRDEPLVRLLEPLAQLPDNGHGEARHLLDNVHESHLVDLQGLNIGMGDYPGITAFVAEHANFANQLGLAEPREQNVSSRS